MSKHPVTLEHTLYALALILGLGLRFLNLGALPLSDFEASWALQALGVAQGAHPALGPNPAYLHLTAVLFYIFRAANFIARFWPALLGSVLVFAPWFFRKRLGRLPALLLTFALAFDPGLLALSRQASGDMLALTFVVYAWAMWRKGYRPLAGVFAGLALLSGASVWFGMTVLGLTWAAWQGSRDKVLAKGEAATPDANAVPVRFRWEKIRGTLGWGFGTLLLIGTLFALSPQGLSALADSLVVYFKGWWTPSGIPDGRLLLALPAYELMPLVFGLVALVRGALKRDPLSIWLGLWALVALLLALAYPGHHVADLTWMLLPLWVLAVLELGRHLDFAGHNFLETAGVAALTMVLLAFGWLDLSMVSGLSLDAEQARMRLFLLLGVLLLLALCLLLVSVGWSVDVARLGAVWGGAVMLICFTLAMATGAATLRQWPTVELWPPGPRVADADLLLQTANQISDWQTGYVDSLPVTITGVDSPALRWLFRGWEVQQADVLSAAESPALVITPSGTQLNLAETYRGQTFTWRQSPAWDTALLGNWLQWFLYRQMPEQNETIILWVRSDLMLDNQGLPTTP